MIQAAKIIGTGLATTGLIGTGVGIGLVSGPLVREFSTARVLCVADPQNSLDVDSNADIMSKFGGNRKDFDKYFEDKLRAINEAYRQESNSAAITGISAKELDGWLQVKNDLVDNVNRQKNDLLDLHDHLTTKVDIPASSSNKQDSSGIEQTEYNS